MYSTRVNCTRRWHRAAKTARTYLNYKIKQAVEIERALLLSIYIIALDTRIDCLHVYLLCQLQILGLDSDYYTYLITTNSSSGGHVSQPIRGQRFLTVGRPKS